MYWEVKLNNKDGGELEYTLVELQQQRPCLFVVGFFILYNLHTYCYGKL